MREEHLWNDTIGDSTVVMARNDGHRCVPLVPTNRFIDLNMVDDSNNRFSSFSYFTIGNLDTILMVDNSMNLYDISCSGKNLNLISILL